MLKSVATHIVPERHVHPKPTEPELICNQYFTGIGSGPIVFSCRLRRSHLLRWLARHNSSLLFVCHGSRITYMRHIWAQIWPLTHLRRHISEESLWCVHMFDTERFQLKWSKTYHAKYPSVKGYLPHTNPFAPNWFCVKTVARILLACKWDFLLEKAISPLFSPSSLSSCGD